MDKELLIQNIIYYSKMKNEPPTNACGNAGVGTSFISNIRNGSMPSVAKVAQLAEYLGVSCSDLVGDKRTPGEDTDDEVTRELKLLLCRLAPEERDVLLRTVRFLIQKNK